MMRLLVEFDGDGLAQVDIVATPGEQGQAHKIWEKLRPGLEQLDVLIKTDVAVVVEVAGNADR
jgi:hypothetical protein